MRKKKLSLLVSGVVLVVGAQSPLAHADENVTVGAQPAADASTASPTSAGATAQEKNNTQLDAVVVTAAKKKSVTAGALGGRSDLETPFSTYTVDSQKIEDTQATTIAKVFEGEAGVVYKGQTYAQSAFALTIRGLALDFTNSYKIDGHPFQMQGVELPLELFDQVQLLKGATGFLYGIGSPGGLVNYVSKKPTATQTLSADVGYSSGSLFSQHLDAGGHFDKDDRLGYRLNAVSEQGTAPNGTQVYRKAGSAYFDAALTSSLVWRVNGLYQERDLRGGTTTFSITPLASAVTTPTPSSYTGTVLPRAVSGDKNLTAYDDYSYYNSTVWTATTGLAWTINDDWNLDTSYSRTYKEIDTAQESISLKTQQGDYALSLNPLYNPTLNFYDVLSKLEGAFATGWLQHHVVGGIEWTKETRHLNDGITNSGGQSDSYPAGGAANWPTANLYGDSLHLEYQAAPSPRRYYYQSDFVTRSAFVSDTLSVDKWSLLLGLRKFQYESSNFTVYGPLSATPYRTDPLTPTVALFYKPRSDTTIYTSYIQALEGGGTVSSSPTSSVYNPGHPYANAGDNLDAIKSKQYELGVKHEGENWSLAAALFRIDRGAGIEHPDSTYTNDGVTRYNGVELNTDFRPVDGLKLSAGGSLIDAKYLKASPVGINANPAITNVSLKGQDVAAVAHVQGTLGIEKEFSSVEGLSVHANADYTGKQNINTATTTTTPIIRAPAYEVVSLGAVYRVPTSDSHQLTYRAEINNLFNKSYWIATSGGVIVGAPRTVSLNARYDF